MKTNTNVASARDVKHRLASALTVALVFAVSVISVLGIWNGITVTARAAVTQNICAVELTNTFDGVKLSWTAMEGAESYEIYRKTENGEYKLIAIADSEDTSWLDETCANGTTYVYYVKPVSATNDWTSNTATITTFFKIPIFTLQIAAAFTMWSFAVGVLLYFVGSIKEDENDDKRHPCRVIGSVLLWLSLLTLFLGFAGLFTLWIFGFFGFPLI